LLAVAGIGKRVSAMIEMADLLLPSGEELFIAAGVEGERQALSALFGRGVGEIVVKRGADGSSWFDADGANLTCAGFRVEEVDPTGAGDCFGAAYLTCRRKGMDPEEALTYANAAGARNVTRQGPMEGIGSFAELDALIASTPRR
jgi:sugar/nucleoside kinase (ribokinase family)